jgi:arylsulfatase A-like enzyme
MIWSWPGRVPTQSARPELVSFYDFLPTVCEAAGVQAPKDRNLLGRSYLNVVTNRPLPKGERWRDLVFGQFRYTEMARDNRYKLVIRHEGKGPNELYDLRVDPREKANQYDNQAYVTIKQNLTKELEAWRARQRA